MARQFPTKRSFLAKLGDFLVVTQDKRRGRWSSPRPIGIFSIVRGAVEGSSGELFYSTYVC